MLNIEPLSRFLILSWCLAAFPASADTLPSSPGDRFARHALAEWVRLGETLPASPATLSKMLSDLPAAVRLAREVTGLDYYLKPADTTEFELTTPRGLVARVRPVELKSDRSSGVFEAVGSGTFTRPNSVFRGRYALRFAYRLQSGGSSGDFRLYIDVENPFLRLLGLFVRGLINERLADEMERMLREAKDVMREAERRLSGGGAF